MEGKSGSDIEFMDDVIIQPAQNSDLSHPALPKLKIMMIPHNSSEMFLKLCSMTGHEHFPFNKGPHSQSEKTCPHGNTKQFSGSI